MEATDAHIVLGYRITRFLDMGFDLQRAGRLAEAGIEWREAKDLVEDGCPHDIAFEILRESD